jgi:AsmA protein
MIGGGAGGAGGLGAVGGIASGVLKNGIPVAIGGTTSNPTFAPNLRGVATGVGAGAAQQLLKGKQNGNQSDPLGNALGGLLNRH